VCARARRVCACKPTCVKAYNACVRVGMGAAPNQLMTETLQLVQPPSRYGSCSGTSHSTRRDHSHTHAVHERVTTRACRPACLRSVGSTFLPHTYICGIGWQHFMDGMRTLHCMAGMYQRAPYHTRAAVHEPALRRTQYL